MNPSYVSVPVFINPYVSRFPGVGVSVGGTPPAHRIVLNHAAIVEATAPCVIVTITGLLFVIPVIVNVIAVPVACPITACIVFDEQSSATVCGPVPGVYVEPT